MKSFVVFTPSFILHLLLEWTEKYWLLIPSSHLVSPASKSQFTTHPQFYFFRLLLLLPFLLLLAFLLRPFLLLLHQQRERDEVQFERSCLELVVRWEKGRFEARGWVRRGPKQEFKWSGRTAEVRVGLGGFRIEVKDGEGWEGSLKLGVHWGEGRFWKIVGRGMGICQGKGWY